MARRLLSPCTVIRYFNGEEGSEAFRDGSDDDMGMDDEEPFDDDPPFEPLEVDDCMVCQYNNTKYIILVVCACSCSPSILSILYLEMKKHSNYISDF